MPQILKVPFSPSSSGHKPVWKWQQRSSATCSASWHRGKGTVSRHVGTAAGGHTQERQGPVDGFLLQSYAIQMLTFIEKRDLSDSRRKWLFQKILSKEWSKPLEPPGRVATLAAIWGVTEPYSAKESPRTIPTLCSDHCSTPQQHCSHWSVS